MPGGRLRVVWSFTTSADRITAIELIADPDRIPELDLVIARLTSQAGRPPRFFTRGTMQDARSFPSTKCTGDCVRSPARTSASGRYRSRQIIGTEGRGGDFDRSFRPRRRRRGRRRRVAQAFPHGDFPPIVAYKLGDAYFVLDGHHRVALAHHRGTEWIDAEVTELHSRWQLSAAADFVELVHAEQERLFVEQSGLGEARPSARIRFSRPSGYGELLETIQVHGYRRAVAEGRVLSPAEVADDWYEHAFRPALAAIDQEGLAAACAHATDAGTACSTSTSGAASSPLSSAISRSRKPLPGWPKNNGEASPGG